VQVAVSLKAAAHLHLEMHTWRHFVFASTQKGAFWAWKNNWSVGYFVGYWNF